MGRVVLSANSRGALILNIQLREPLTSTLVPAAQKLKC